MEKSGPHAEAGQSAERRNGQDNNDPASKLARIAAKARSHPKEQFNNLMHLVSRERIEGTLNKISSKSAPGADGMTREQAQMGLPWLLPPLLTAMHQGRYAAPPVRRVYIPKAAGGQRPLGVPTILDRAIQGATAEVLGAIYEQDFLSCSFGFRLKLSCHNALATINEALDRMRLKHALEVDIRDFFGSIDHGWMMKFLRHRISDPRMLKLLESWLKAGVLEDGALKEPEQGTPQGGSISPLLANVYLHYVLDIWFEKAVKPKLRGKARLVRYADDFVLLFADPADRTDVEALLKARLAQFGLAVAEEKTHKTDLGLRENKGQDRRHISFLGFAIYRKKTRRGNGVVTVFRTDAKRYRRAKAALKEKLLGMMHREVKTQAKQLNALLIGHYNYYGMAGNMRSLSNFANFAIWQWRRCLSRRSQKGSVRWARMAELLKDFKVAAPRIRILYRDLRSYARP